MGHARGFIHVLYKKGLREDVGSEIGMGMRA